MLTRHNNGTYQVTSLKQAKEALAGMRNLQHEIDALMKEYGITEMMADAAEMKKAATRWADETNRERIDFDGGYAQLRRDKYGGTWVATDEDLKDAPEQAVSVLSVLRKKIKDPQERRWLWKRITRSVINPDALNAEIKAGTLTVEEIEGCYFEKEKAAYLRLYDE